MTTLVWHQILQKNSFFYPSMSLSASSMYFWKIHSKWQIIFTQLCELFSLSSQNTVNSAFHIASPAITDWDFSSPDLTFCVRPLECQEKAAEVKTGACPQEVRLLIKGARERKAGHLSTTRRKHTMPAGQKACLCCVHCHRIATTHTYETEINTLPTHVLDSFTKI